jgi:hypothetical protein
MSALQGAIRVRVRLFDNRLAARRLRGLNTQLLLFCQTPNETSRPPAGKQIATERQANFLSTSHQNTSQTVILMIFFGICCRSQEFRSSGVRSQESGVRSQEFRSSGVQEFRSSGVQESGVQESGVQESGVQEFRSSGVQEFRSSGVQEFRSSGVQEFRSSGVQEFRGSGVQEFRSQESGVAGVRSCRSQEECRRARSPAFCRWARKSYSQIGDSFCRLLRRPQKKS